MKKTNNTLLFLVIFILSFLLNAKENLTRPKSLNIKNTLSGQPAQTMWNVNNIAGWIQYDGWSSRDPVTGESGVKYPRGTAGVIFQDGIIWGGYINDGIQPAKRVGGQTYSIGTSPGWIETPGTPGNPPLAIDPSDPRVRIYRIRANWQSLTVSDPEVLLDAAEINRIPVSQVTTQMAQAVIDQYALDWSEWPGDLGAPYYDLNANGQWDSGIDEPGLQSADQVVWFVCNDLDPALTNNLYGSPPIGIEQQVTIWGYKVNSSLSQLSLRRDRIINKSGYAIDSMFVAKWVDPDLGNYADDLVGCDTLLNAGYCFNGSANDDEFANFGLPPAAIGYALLQGPIVPSPGDTAYFNFRKIPDFKNRPITSFSWFAAGSNISDPPLASYLGTIAWYNMLNGYTPTTTDSLVPYVVGAGPGQGNPTKFPLAGDPVSGIGDIDGTGNNLPPSDRRMVLTSGPFTMQPGDSQEVVIALTGGILPFGNQLTSITEMKQNIQLIRSLYGKSMVFPGVSQNINHPNATTTELQVQVDLRNFNNVINAEIDFAPVVGSEPGFNLLLFDDGAHNDSLAGDSIWGNSYSSLNRKYPYKGDVTIHTTSGSQTFQGLFNNNVRLRPLPELINWRIAWENGQQDLSINNDENVHLLFDIHNRDAVNDINNIIVSGNEFNITILPGATILNDSLIIIQTGPSQGDSLIFHSIISFDGHFDAVTTTLPVVHWSPGTTWGDTLNVISITGTTDNLIPIVADPSSLTGHTYMITFIDDTLEDQLLWRLTDQTAGSVKLDSAQLASYPNFPHPVIDGIQWQLTELNPDFLDFQVVANGAGPLVPPEGAAADWQGFPGLGHPTDRQQVGAGHWLFHTGDTAPTGTRGSYGAFLSRSMRGSNFDYLIPYDWEMRFTAAGSYAVGAFTDGLVRDVPFELWCTGIGTPDDPSDDYRVIPWFLELGAVGGVDRDIFVYEVEANDHAVSGGTNDPYTDWIYWRIPEDASPGTAGYDAYVASLDFSTTPANQGTYAYDGYEVIARSVLVNWNGGDVTDPDFYNNVNQSVPEEGTIFRLITTKPNTPQDTLLVVGTTSSITAADIPNNFFLSQNFPNPFNPVTNIRFGLANRVKVKLEIFNILGQKVKTLINKNMPAGKYELQWNAKNDTGKRVSSGVYFYRLITEDKKFIVTRKMLLLK